MFFELVLCLAVSLLALSSAQYNETRHLRTTALKAEASKLYVLAEKLSERYYQNQIRERKVPDTYKQFHQINANYPCLFGTYPVGADTEASTKDGHKFVCGLHHIDASPIVYSFGSNKQQDFEESILTYRPDAHIFTYDVLESHLPEMSVRKPQITYSISGLGPTGTANGIKLMLLHEMMKEHGHTYIDVLKVDIENGEYPWVDAEPLDTFDRIGQLQIEVHDIALGAGTVKINALVDALEKRNLRIFHKELNIWDINNPCCMEFAFIRLNWSSWNAFDKHKLLPLP